MLATILSHQRLKKKQFLLQKQHFEIGAMGNAQDNNFHNNGDSLNNNNNAKISEERRERTPSIKQNLETSTFQQLQEDVRLANEM